MCNQLNYVFPGALIMLKSAEVRYVISENSAVYRKLLEVRLKQSADYRRSAADWKDLYYPSRRTAAL